MDLKTINDVLKKNNYAFCENINKHYSFEKNFKDFFNIDFEELEKEILSVIYKDKYALLIFLRFVGFLKAYNDITGRNEKYYV